MGVEGIKNVAIFPLMWLGDKSARSRHWLFPQTHFAWFDLNISMWTPIATFLFHNHDGPWPDIIKAEQKNWKNFKNFKWRYTPYTCPAPGKGGREGQPAATSVCFVPATATTSGDKGDTQKLGMYLDRGRGSREKATSRLIWMECSIEALNSNGPL